jgi:hypothetical protein
VEVEEALTENPRSPLAPINLSFEIETHLLSRPLKRLLLSGPEADPRYGKAEGVLTGVTC